MKKVQHQSGSIWRRWDPHIHAPGTVFNDQFGTDDPWGNYLSKLEASHPRIEAIGITDYYSLEVYEEVRAWQDLGRLSDIGLIFPNIEMRYAVGTSNGTPVNFHLLVSPDDPEHVAQAKRFLERLTFKHSDETYRCTQSDIVRLGRAHGSAALDEKAAFKVGANQFKVEVDSFLKEWTDSPWIQNNALIALAASSKDGAAGLQSDASLSALRQKIERRAHIIFSSQPKQRAFWLGQGPATVDELNKTYGGRKPCLHGSDAHSQESVATPDKERNCWIKGDATFETLRQACMEPDLRAMVSVEAPDGAYESQTITSISMQNADWFGQDAIPLNGGLVGVIGARGSGKTALADMIAAGAYALSRHVSNKSFVHRARDYLVDAKSILSWRDGSQTSNSLDAVEMEELMDSSRVRYLSQQFVEQLCSAEGATDELVAEIERVIFTAHPKEDRFGAENFGELLSITAARGREARVRHEGAISGIGERIARERDKQDGLKANRLKLKELQEIVAKDGVERKRLVPKSAEVHAKEFEVVSQAAETIRERIEKAKLRDRALDLLLDHIKDFRTRISLDDLNDLKVHNANTFLEDSSWAAFKTDFVGDVEVVVDTAKKNAKDVITKLTGLPQKSPVFGEVTPPSEESLLPKGAEITALPLSTLASEERRLQRLMGIDSEKQNRHTKLTEKIRAVEAQIKKLEEFIAAGERSKTEIETLISQRSENYRGVFEGITAEEQALQTLYQPLSDRLADASGALSKLTFSIRRIVDVQAWAERGENLIDKRKAGDFKGRGALLEAAEAELGNAWRSGAAEEVAKAMASFRANYNDTIIRGAIVDKSDASEWRAWGASVSEWLYSTDHIRVAYDMQYEGVGIETLSPGTRGIVLLLLYLAIDMEDDRPLIIDQPEENLDPKSIFEELVGLFREAKQRRQIIIVTHNANLIVNTDADQVIVAECGALSPGKLPKINYVSGALEDAVIRKHVCDILEGGERAFQERAKRLRVALK